MKRYGNLYPQIVEFENIYLAARKAKKGIRKYFPSIDHEILKQLIRRKIKCQNTLWLIDTIIDNSNEQEKIINHFPGDNLLTPVERRHGLPIGNLTSQWMANIYLSDFDHFVKEQLKVKKYLRYVDDFALFSDDHQLLKNCRIAIEEYLEKLRLRIHPIKSQLFQTKHGATFLGFRVFPEKIRVRNSNLHRGRKRLKKLQKDYFQGKVSLEHFKQSLNSWEAHLEHGDTWQLRQKIFSSLVFTRS